MDGENRTARGEFFDVLYVGECEPLKAAVHGVLLATVALCAVYNAAAWLRRRERHLGINALVYSLAAMWEHQHVQQHLACRPPVAPPVPDKIDPLEEVA
jgi:hypothetical protein